MRETTNPNANAIGLKLFDTTEGRTNPYPLYHELRALDPVHRSSKGMWVLTRYADCTAMLRDPRFGKNYEKQMDTFVGPRWRQHPVLKDTEGMMVNMDGPEHTRLRGVVVKAFQRKAIDGLRPMMESTIHELIDPVVEAGGGDILTAIGFPLPVKIIGEMLGVPAADRERFRVLVTDITAAIEVDPTDEDLDQADNAYQEIVDYFQNLIAQKRRHPDDLVLSDLANPRDEADRLTDDEIINLIFLLFAAGFETTTNLFGNGMIGLLKQPEQIELLRSDPALFKTLPEELLRFDGTAQMVSRYAKTDVEIDGVTIPAGESVLALLGAANHDPAKFQDPDRINVKRGKFRPLSFGGGEHFCLGAMLARAEIEITFRAVLSRLDSIRLAEPAPRYRDRLTLRGLESLHVTCQPGKALLDTPDDEDTLQEEPTVRMPAPPIQISTQCVRPGSEDGDARWRNALRSEVETDVQGASVWLQGASDLAATIVLLARAELFRHCTSDEIAELARTAYPMTFEAGEALCSEGGESLELYVIAEGQADVSIGGEHIGIVKERDVVGERGPIEERTRTATVIARNHMLTWAISRDRLRALVERSTHAREGMLAHIRRSYPDA